MKTILTGDRLGGVFFDVQQCIGEGDKLNRSTKDHRAYLIACIARLVEIVADMDTAALYAQNPKSGGRCVNPEHDRFTHRVEDCTECNPVNPRIEGCVNLMHDHNPLAPAWTKATCKKVPR
jgi:hypothetical protein